MTDFTGIGLATVSTDDNPSGQAWGVLITSAASDFAVSLSTIESDGAAADGQSFTLLVGEDAVTDALGHTTKSYKDVLGRVIQTLYADGSFTQTLYGGQTITGQQVTSIDRFGHATDQFHDAAGRLTDQYGPAVADAANGGAVSRPHMHYDYGWVDADGRYDRVIDPRGHITKTYTDDQGRVVKTVFHDGSSVSTLYGQIKQPVPGHVVPDQDILGYQITKIDALGRATDLFYDQFRRLTDVYLPAVDDGTTTAIDFKRPHWHYVYDALGRQTTQTDPNQHATTFEYNDPSGQRTARELPDGHRESWTYDDLGRTKTHVDFNGQVTAYIYDSDPGLPAAERRRLGNVVFERRYPSLAAYDGGLGTPAEETHFFYDGLGRRTQVVETSASATRTTDFSQTFDLTNHVRQETTTSPEGQISHEYDFATGRLERTWTAENDTSYEYDDLGRLWKVTAVKLNGQAVNAVTEYAYDAAGNLDTVTYHNDPATTTDDVVHDHVYDGLNRLTDLTVRRNGQTLFSQSYILADDGQRESVLETNQDGETVRISWTYDALNRLTSETRDADDDGQPDTDDYTDFFAFDLAGNRVLKLRGWDANGNGQLDAGEPVSGRTAYRYNERDQLLGEGPDADQDGVPDTLTETYAYDDNGSTTLKSSDGQDTIYIWDLRNKLIGLDADGDGTLDDAGDATFAYDFAGVRVRRSVIGDQTTYYLQSLTNPTGYSQVLEEWTGPNGQTTRSLARSYLIGQDVIAQSRTGAPAGREIEYLLYDGGGHTRGLLDATGQPLTAEIYAYDAYGNRIEGPSVTATSLLYRGEYFDATLGQYVLRARYYDPVIGRFWSFDSYEASSSDPLSLHKYLYANANPVYYTDPTGRFSSTEIAVVAGGALAFMGFGSFVFAKAGKSAGYGAVTGLLGAAGITMGYAEGRLGSVLTEAVTTAIASTVISLGFDLAEGGVAEVSRNGVMKYVAVAFEGFCWGAFGKAVLDPVDLAPRTSYLSPKGATPWQNDLGMGAVNAAAAGLAYQAGAVLIGYSIDVGSLMLPALIGRSEMAWNMLKASSKDCLSNLIAIGLSTLLLPLQGVSVNVPGMRFLPPSVRARAAEFTMKAAFRLPNDVSDALVDAIFDRLRGTLH